MCLKEILKKSRQRINQDLTDIKNRKFISPALCILTQKILSALDEHASGHLVRCGYSSVYDVNFGKEVGDAAVVLLKGGHSGVTVTGVQNGKIQYSKTVQVIKQRYVELDVVALHE